MALRRLAGGGTPLSFVLVATTFLVLFLLGWRAVGAPLLERRPGGRAVSEQVALLAPDDASGRAVGVAPRERVRRENLPHSATGVLVRRSDG